MNEAGSVGFVVVLFIVVAVFVMVALWASQHNLRATYRNLARRFKGKYTLHGWNDPRVQFPHKGLPVYVSIAAARDRRSAYFTQIQLRWPDTRFRCEIYPEGFWSRLNKFLGMRDIEIGSARFDNDYVITGNNVNELREFLAIDVQRHVDELRLLGTGTSSFKMRTEQSVVAGDIYLSISGGRFLIKKRGMLCEFEQLVRFVELTLELYDCALAASAEGIEFVEPQIEAILSLSDAVCQICGETVKLDAVVCRGCKTPHHKDCWEYYGACSTYGCGQRIYLVKK